MDLFRPRPTITAIVKFKQAKSDKPRFARHLSSLLVVFSLMAGMFLALGGPANTQAATTPQDVTVGQFFPQKSTISPDPGPITLTVNPAALPNGKVGQPYTVEGNFSADGGTAPYSFTVDPASLPDGLSLTNAEGKYALSGTPTKAGTFTFTVQATDGSCVIKDGVSLEDQPIGAKEVCSPNSGSHTYTVKIEGSDPPPPVGVAGYASDPLVGETVVITARPHQTASSNLMVSNIGSTDLVLSNPKIIGKYAEELKIISPAFPLTIASGSPAQAIVIQCTPSSAGRRKVVLTLNTNDPSQKMVGYYVVCGADEVKRSADLLTQLRVTPDRQAKNSPQTEISYELSIKNVGEGVGGALRLMFPINPNLVPAYTRFSDSRMWVSEMVTEGDHPYMKIAMPEIQPYQSYNATLVFHPKGGVKNGTVIREQFSAVWDDQIHTGMTSTSNSALVTLVDESGNRDDTRGAVIWFAQHGQKVKLGKSIVLSGDFYTPEEAIDFWYSDGNGDDVSLGMFWADKQGKVSVELSSNKLKEGHVYTVVGKGRRSAIIGSAAITVIPAEGDGSGQPEIPAEGLH